MQIVINGLNTLRTIVQKAGPYLMLEMVLPGGTLFALLLYLYRQHKSGAGNMISGRAAASARQSFKQCAPLQAPSKIVFWYV